MLAPICNDEFELGPNSVSNTQDYFKCFIKKHEAVSDNPPIIICVNKIENRLHLE